LQALKLFGQGKETPEVIETITGKKVAEFDREFRLWLDIRLAAYKGTFRLPTSGLDDLTALEVAIAAHPKDASAHARMALGQYYAGDADKAAASAADALAIDPRDAIARFIMAEVTLRAGDPGEARKKYRALVADGIDSFDIRTRLAQIAQGLGDLPDMERQLCAAKRLDPERSFPYGELAEYYEHAGHMDKALVELEHYVFLEQMQLAPLKKLITEYSKLGKWEKVRVYGELAMYIEPGDPEVLLELGKAYVGTGDGKQALFTYDTALMSTPPLRRPALAHLGRARAYQVLGDKAKARGALDKALATEPETAEALELKKQLK
jgi:tetratricopeptide (TPR) repeat protein